MSTARVTAQFPPPDITPEEIEEYVAQLLSSTEPLVDNLTVMIHDKIEGSDGAYDFDATVRYQLAGMSFLVLVEAKRHKNPIKRELVQVLHQKVQSVGGHKGVMISTAPLPDRRRQVREGARYCPRHGHGRPVHLRDERHVSGIGDVTRGSSGTVQPADLRQPLLWARQ
jgi:hypothetical protein